MRRNGGVRSTVRPRAGIARSSGSRPMIGFTARAHSTSKASLSSIIEW